MTREDVIRMAREAGRKPDRGVTYQWDYFDIEHFVALVAAAEREACARRLETTTIRCRDNPDMEPFVKDMLKDLAHQIRARGEKA